MQLSRRKRIIFALAAFALASVAALGGLLAVDMYLHSRFERSAGVNIWGYRGRVAGRKVPGELRVAVLGGSTAYGYGVTSDESMPARLEEHLRTRRRTAGQPPASVLNLGFNNEGVYSYTFTMRDYAYLGYDVVLMSQGYNDLGVHPNTQVYRHESPLYRMTGYLPIFPVAFKEKASGLLHGGDISAVYREAIYGDDKTVFRPGIAKRATAGALNATVAIAESLGNQFSRISPDASRPKPGNAVIQGPQRDGDQWAAFLKWMTEDMDLALSNGKKVVVLSQPYLVGIPADRHKSQQAALRAMLMKRYAGDSRVRYVDLSDAIDLKDSVLSYDGMHLTAKGNELLATLLVDPVLSLAEAGR